MENATKALLIAAAVLIAIVLIALGVNLIKAGGNTSGKAGEVGTALKEQTENTSQTAVGKIEGLLGDETSGVIDKKTVEDLLDSLEFKEEVTFNNGSNLDNISESTTVYVTIGGVYLGLGELSYNSSLEDFKNNLNSKLSEMETALTYESLEISQVVLAGNNLVFGFQFKT